MNRSVIHRVICSLICVFTAAGAEAVILAGGDGSQNTNAPSGGQGWDYVGRINKGSVYSSVTYISNNWFITGNHVKELDNPASVILGESTYDIDPNSWTRLQNSTNGNADLIMFRVVGGTVGLPGLTVRSSPTSIGSSLTMIGNGPNRETSETSWNISWVEGGKPTVYQGYSWASGSAKRWGSNHMEANAGLIDDGYGVTDVFYTDFDDIGGSEAQGARYDSGGGVFYNQDGAWELAGIMIFTGQHPGQPWPGSSVYDNLTYMADMQYYAGQIHNTAQIDDLDEDGIPDAWEYEQTGSSTGVVASVDQDGDGISGTAEWIADTDPTDEDSFQSLGIYSNATYLVFNSSIHREYRIEYRTNLTDTNESWQVEPGLDWFMGGSPYTGTNVTVFPGNRFYRVRVRLF